MPDALFPQSPRRDYELSQLTAHDGNYAHDDTVRWTSIKSAKAPTCDECAARAWETQGTERATVARTKRVVRTSELYLCHAHARLWKERDLDQ
jgi:hypothetical protein